MKEVKPVLVLDAMDVMYRAGDDVAELLIPFLQARGIRDVEEVERLYMEASLGKRSSASLWRAFNLDPNIEDKFLDGHELVPRLKDFLAGVPPFVEGMWCLSNDVTEWSNKLRRKFDLDRYLDGFIISGDLGVRKPERAIFTEFLKQSGTSVENAMFVDDRPQNLNAAAELGFRTVLFDPSGSPHAGAHRSIRTFQELHSLIRGR